MELSIYFYLVHDDFQGHSEGPIGIFIKLLANVALAVLVENLFITVTCAAIYWPQLWAETINTFPETPFCFRCDRVPEQNVHLSIITSVER